ncbi:thioredoxin [Clostridium tepidum]|jgi:thioredoxin 1|uniref:Thioredoxin n=1 Tax=Clostridium tepidum TaxID=1962263 RepID=A0A1S9IG72_9CLOT|nr:thioredoxin [Clostridium tepidum]MCR1934470.1 thioredoxin [Clostridium tepidum]MDU6878079.1 thioredoxin [Clostridium botulinum]OOO62390.1 thioredoxin [Clostridium tepidum]OOO69316.1 thioredoxin [Clostridium tepidum]
MVKEINESIFGEEVLNSEVPVVVDFWATWCGPCKMLAPVVEEVSEELGQKVKFVKINVDENPVISTQYKISSIPTLMTFKAGKAVETLVGFRPKEVIKSAVEKHI